MHKRSGSNFRRLTVLASSFLIMTLFLTACVSAPVVPDAGLTDARDAISSAEQSGARQYASAEFEVARQKLMLAEQAVIAERMVEARQLAEQSRITAQLAIARTASAKAADINRQIERGADALYEEMQRTGEQQ